MSRKQQADPRAVEYVKLSELQPDPRNPKDHDEEAISGSFTRFGVVDLITVDSRTGHMVSGHGRAEALRRAQAAGEEPPAGVQVDDEGEWTVPVVVGWASRSDTESGAALIALNRTTELGGWDEEKLLAQLAELEDEAGFEGVGFGAKDVQRLRKSLDETETYDTRSEVPETSGINADGERSDDSTRMIVVTMPADVYAWALERLREAEQKHDVRGNARAFLMMLGEYTGIDVPEEYVEQAAGNEEEWE